MYILLLILVSINLVLLLVQVFRSKKTEAPETDKLREDIAKLEPAVREELKAGREETNTRLKENREEFASGMNKQQIGRAHV